MDAAGQEDRAQPPPELVMWLKVKQWGDPWGAGWMQWPARLFTRVRLARNVYEVWSGYTQAKDRTKWLAEPRNAGAAGMVGEVKSLRFGGKAGEQGRGGAGERVRRWEEWVEIRD